MYRPVPAPVPVPVLGGVAVIPTVFRLFTSTSGRVVRLVLAVRSRSGSRVRHAYTVWRLDLVWRHASRPMVRPRRDHEAWPWEGGAGAFTELIKLKTWKCCLQCRRDMVIGGGGGSCGGERQKGKGITLSGCICLLHCAASCGSKGGGSSPFARACALWPSSWSRPSRTTL
jgi:hypothetical protein